MFHRAPLHRLLILTAAGLCLGLLANQYHFNHPARATQLQLKRAFGQLPLRFERNQGQTGAAVEYLARGPGYGLWLTRREAVLQLRGSDAQAPGAQVRLRLVGMNPAPLITGCAPLAGQSHYLLGATPQRWRTGLSHFAQVKYSGVYPGIDLLWYGNQQQLEYDFQPGDRQRRFCGEAERHGHGVAMAELPGRQRERQRQCRGGGQ